MSKSNDKKVAIAELVCRALADLRDPQGSTEKQIREYIEINYKIPDVGIKQSITTALKTGVAFGLISKKRGHYQLSKLVDNLRVIAAKGRRKTQRARSQKPKIRKIARTPAIRKTSRTPAIRKTATKRPRTRSTTRGRPKSICTDASCNKKCDKHVLSCKNQQKYYGKNDSDDDEGDSQEQDITDNEERDDVKENVIQQNYNDCQDNGGVDSGYNNNDEIDEVSDDEEMEADDQEEYDDDDDDEES